MLVSKIIEKLDIPHEEGEWVEIRSLSFTAMEEASDNKQERDLRQVKRMGGDVFEAIMRSSKQADSSGKGDESATAKVATVDSYDKETLLVKAIVAWSYDGKPTMDRIRDLDSRTAAWLSREVFERNKPDTEETVGND